MTFYMDLIKIEEAETYAKYKFYIDESCYGIIEIRKSDGYVSEIQAEPNDESGRIFQRSAWALMRHWKRGEYPEKTCWAS